MLFKTGSPLTIFEIGACEGEDSMRYARLFPHAKVYALEPLPKNVEYIRSNIAKYQAHNVSVHQLALSSINGTTEFHVSSGRPEHATETDWDYGNKSNSLLPPDKHKELADFISFNEQILVETQTLKTFCTNHHIIEIDFIHMDVQGAELMVLEGAADYLQHIKAIWLEVSTVHLYKNQPLVNDVQDFMQQHNFVLAKNCVTGMQGDHLYISTKHFPNHVEIVKKINSKPSLLNIILKKLGIN